MFRIAYTKYNKRFTAKKVKVGKQYGYLRGIMKNIYMRAVDNEKMKGSKLKRTLFVTPTVRPERDDTIELRTKYTRFK